MSAAISNQWWAAKGLLTEQAKDVRNMGMQTHIQLQTWRNKWDGAVQEEAGGGGGE